MRRVNHKATAKVLAGILAAVLGLSALTGCDDYVMAGDFYEPSVAPMDFSPYGYDYSMYDLFTSDI